MQRKAYDTLKDTIVINILNFDYLQETDEFHSIFRLLEEKKHFSLTDALAMHFIEMPKLRQKWRLKEVAPQKDPLVRWLFLLDGNENEEIRKELEVIAVEDLMIDRAIKDWEEASADPKQRELYFDRKKAILDELAAVETSRLNAERAKAEGIAEGKAETICQYLEVRFDAESQPLQDAVRTITDLDVLNRIIRQIFSVNQLEEAKVLIQGSLVSQ